MKEKIYYIKYKSLRFKFNESQNVLSLEEEVNIENKREAIEYILQRVDEIFNTKGGINVEMATYLDGKRID